MSIQNSIYQYSDPKIVFDLAVKKLNNETLAISTRKNKKYMIINPVTSKYVHFGEMGYTDFTKHKDEKRRMLFMNRNSKWKNAKPYTPAFLSYYLLW